MKKVFSILLVTGLILFILAGCSPLESPDKDKPDTPAEITPSAVLSAVPLSFKEYESSGSARSAAAARNAAGTPVPLGNDVPLVLDTRAIPDIDGNNADTLFSKLFLTVLKNDVSKLPGFEFGKDKTIGHLEELSPETEAFLLANDMGSGNEMLEFMDWGTINVAITDDEVLVYWSFTMDQFSSVICIHGTYVGDSFVELEIVSDIPLPPIPVTYYEKYYYENGKKAELAAYLVDTEGLQTTTFARIERIDDTYVSYLVRKNGDSYKPVEIGIMDSTGGGVYYLDDTDEESIMDCYSFIDTDYAVMEEIEYIRDSRKYQEHFATRYLELVPGNTLEFRAGPGELPDMFLGNQQISYGQSSSDGEHFYTTLYFGQKNTLLDADLTGTDAEEKLRFLKHDLVHRLKEKMDAFREASVNPAQYTGLNVDHILELKANAVAWGAALN